MTKESLGANKHKTYRENIPAETENCTRKIHSSVAETPVPGDKEAKDTETDWESNSSNRSEATVAKSTISQESSSENQSHPMTQTSPC